MFHPRVATVFESPNCRQAHVGLSGEPLAAPATALSNSEGLTLLGHSPDRITIERHKRMRK